MEVIKNRKYAGKLLSKLLERNKWPKNSLVLALPRGGVPLAVEIAKALNLPLDLILVKKIGAPGNPEYAIGAMALDYIPLWNKHIVKEMNLNNKRLKPLLSDCKNKLEQQYKRWKEGRDHQDLSGKNIIIVDDGLATGLTMKAAIQYLKSLNVSEIHIAVPVAAPSTLNELKPMVNTVTTLYTPTPFISVGQWYKDFDQVSNEYVTKVIDSLFYTKHTKNITIPLSDTELAGTLDIPENAKGLIIFSHGSGSSHKSPRNKRVADALGKEGFATLLFDLLTPMEDLKRENRFNIHLLSERLVHTTNWAKKQHQLKDLSIGYFGASTGAPAALLAALNVKSKIFAIVSRGGRPDMAEEYLEKVKVPTLLLVGSEDPEVIKLNEYANSRLEVSELVIIPKAGHLFEEPGTLQEVTEKATNWFKTKLEDNIEIKKWSQDHIVENVKQIAKKITSYENLAPLIEKMSQSRIVMLGEASHGTEEFYKMRSYISQILIEDYNFDFIAVEGDWPDCYEINQYINADKSAPPKDPNEVLKKFNRWPTWMWSNKQILNLMKRIEGKSVGFYGLDIYSLYESLDQAKSYIQKLNPDIANTLQKRYSCFAAYNRDEINYAKSVAKDFKGCEKEVLANLQEILRIRLKSTPLNQKELFDFQQNAKVIRNAEKYYREMIFGGATTWNIRDEHMMDTLDSLLQSYGEKSKAIIWAHNSHVGDYHATDMPEAGYINLGGLARERYGMDQVELVGFGTNEGEVIAGSAWGSNPTITKIDPAAKGTHENIFHEVAKEMRTPAFYISTADGKDFLNFKAGHRAIGVVYQNSFEKKKVNYVPTNILKRYDEFIFIDKTNALETLIQIPEKGVLPASWPAGL